MGRPCGSAGHVTRPTVSRVSRIQRFSSDFALPLSVSATTPVSTRIVLVTASALRRPGTPSGATPGGFLPSAIHS